MLTAADINKYYDDLYKKELDTNKAKEDQQKTALDRNIADTNNQYNNIYKDLDTQYGNDTKVLDENKAEGLNKSYQARNDLVQTNVTNTNRVRDWMAKNNLLRSGENADAMLRSNTDMTNSLSSNKASENSFLKGVMQKLAELGQSRDSNKNKYQTEQNSKINAYKQQISDLDTNTAEQDIFNNVEATRSKDLMTAQSELDDYNRQQAAAAQAARVKATASRTAATNKPKTTKPPTEKESMYSAMQQAGVNGQASQFISENANGISGNLGEATYNDMVKRAQALDDLYWKNNPREEYVRQALIKQKQQRLRELNGE